MSSLIIDDNFLSNSEIKEIEQKFYRLPAIFSPATNYIPEGQVLSSADRYANRFMYCSYENEENFTNKLAIGILEKFCAKHNIKYDLIGRTRSNTTFLCNEKRPSIPHVDSEINHLVLLYYVNDSDGDTILYKNKYDEEKDNEMIVEVKISPKAGRAVLFDGSLYHSFHYPNIYNTRSVININIRNNGETNV
jgi:hypothetical protein